MITSHIVYKIKIEEKGKLRLKARLCPHGNRDKFKCDVRTDSATVQFDVIRLLLSIFVTKNFRIGYIDIKRVYLKIGPIKREIYVRPPKGIGAKRGFLWLLKKVPYRITEAGRQWAMVLESWLVNPAQLCRVSEVSQIVVRRTRENPISLMITKVTDDILMAGSINEMKNFVERIGNRFVISKSKIDEEILSNSCKITQESKGDVKI